MTSEDSRSEAVVCYIVGDSVNEIMGRYPFLVERLATVVAC